MISSLVWNLIFLVIGVLIDRAYLFFVARYGKNKKRIQVNVQSFLFALVVLFSLGTTLQTNNKSEAATEKAQDTADYAKCLAEQNTDIINAITSNSALSQAKFKAIGSGIAKLTEDLANVQATPGTIKADIAELNRQLIAADAQRIPYKDLIKGTC